MEQVSELIAGREYKCALVRLWHLAGQAVPGGGTRLDQWFESARNELATHRIEEFFLVGQPAIGLADLCARPTDVIRCLDQRLAEERKKSLRSAAFEVDGQRYFLVPCSPHGGFEQQQPVRFAAYMRHHRIIADPLLPGVRAVIRDLAGFPALQRELQQIAEDPRQVLLVGLGLFNDGHRPEGDCRPVEDDRQTVFFRGTSGDAERLASAREQIDAAEAAGVELLVFPELTLSPANQQALADELLQRWQRGRTCRIPLLVLGSFHCQDADFDCRRNRAQLLWGRDGSTLATHDKFSPATLGGLTESFTPGNAALFLSTAIGNLSLAVCKDIIDDYADLWLKKLGPDWLLVASLSDSAREHVGFSREIWNRHRCVSIVANQPLAAQPPVAGDGSTNGPVYGYVRATELMERDPTRNPWACEVPLQSAHIQR